MTAGRGGTCSLFYLGTCWYSIVFFACATHRSPKLGSTTTTSLLAFSGRDATCRQSKQPRRPLASLPATLSSVCHSLRPTANSCLSAYTNTLSGQYFSLGIGEQHKTLTESPKTHAHLEKTKTHAHFENQKKHAHLDGRHGGSTGRDAAEDALLHRKTLSHLYGRVAGDLRAV